MTSKLQNKSIVALATQCGSMRALADAMGIHWTMLYAWTRGEGIPNFAHMTALGRYDQANNCVLRLAGKTLAELFGQDIGEKPVERVTFNLSAPWRQCDGLDFGLDLPKLLQSLNARQLFVLTARMGGESLESIGVELGITRERVRQIEITAKRKVRFYCRRLGYFRQITN